MPSLDQILRAAAFEAGTSVRAAKSSSKLQEPVYARWAFALLARRFGYTYKEIARKVNKDHSTVIHGLRRAEAMNLTQEFGGLVARVSKALELLGVGRRMKIRSPNPSRSLIYRQDQKRAQKDLAE